MNQIVFESWKKEGGEKISVNSSCGECRLIGLQPAKHSRQVGQGRLDKRLKPSGAGWGGET